MSIGNLIDNGNKGRNMPYQLAVLQLLGQIDASINTLPGIDYETRTTTYKAIAAGPGYSIDDILVRYDIIDVTTGIVATTVWFNQTTQLVITAPSAADLVPVQGSSSVTIINGPGLAAVNIQDGGNSITVDIDKAATSTNTSVARAITVGGVLILAANAARKGATISNDSGAILYLKFAAIGGTSSTSFTVRLTANAYYEVPFGYTGVISGIWASAGAGNALVSELT